MCTYILHLRLKISNIEAVSQRNMLVARHSRVKPFLLENKQETAINLEVRVE